MSVEWAFEGTNLPIVVSSYELSKYIPKDILEKLPTEEELNLHLDIEDDDETAEDYLTRAL